MFSNISSIPCIGFLCLSFAVTSDAQVYNYNLESRKTEFISSAIAYTGIYIYDHLRPVEVLDDFEDIDPNGIWGFDRSALNQYSDKADKWSDYTLYASIASPFLVNLSNDFLNRNVTSTILIGLQGYLLQDAVKESVKIFAERPRPYLFNQGTDILNTTLKKNDTKSFFSGHTSNSAYFSFLAAKIYSDSHPESDSRYLVWSLAALLPATTGYLRYKAGRHFPSDVITGYLVGAGFGILIPELYKNENFRIYSGSQGIGFTLNF